MEASLLIAVRIGLSGTYVGRFSPAGQAYGPVSSRVGFVAKLADSDGTTIPLAKILRVDLNRLQAANGMTCALDFRSDGGFVLL
jgi:hypothetical protein